jgi:hypothetical protein
MGDNLSPRIQCGIDMSTKSLDLTTRILKIVIETRESGCISEIHLFFVNKLLMKKNYSNLP